MNKEMNDAEFLLDLAERLRYIPVFYGTDQGDVDRLIEISKIVPKKEAKKTTPK